MRQNSIWPNPMPFEPTTPYKLWGTST